MKSRIPEYEKEKEQKRKEKADKKQNARNTFESIISKHADKAGIDIDEYKSIVYSSIYEGSNQIEFSQDFIKQVKSAAYKDKKGEIFRAILIEGKRRYEDKVKQNNELLKQKTPYLSRAQLPLDHYLETNISIYGYRQLPKLSLDEYGRLEKIRETLIDIEPKHNYSEKEAIIEILKKRNFT